MVEIFDRPSVKIQVDPEIFPLDIVLLASYYLVNRLSIRVEGDPKEAINVSLTTKLNQGNKHFQSSEDILWAFNERLVRVSIDQYNLEKNSDVRNALIKAAFLFELPEEIALSEVKTPLENVTYVHALSEKEGKIILTVYPAKNPLQPVFLSLFSIADRVKDNCCFAIQRHENEQIFCEISPRKDTNLTIIWNQIASELEKHEI